LGEKGKRVNGEKENVLGCGSSGLPFTFLPFSPFSLLGEVGHVDDGRTG
jgi:hypothetical protein